jgi:hypothetical protein
MKVEVSVKGRGKKLARRGRMAQGYFCRRNGILRFYAFEDSSYGNRINRRQPIPKKKLKRKKF